MNDFDAGLSPAGDASGHGELALASEAAPAGVFGTMGPGAGEAAVAPAGAIRASTRPKRKPKSALGTIVGVVLGGGMGVALAPLAIWWIAGTDPFELAPKVPTALQFILPEKLRTQGSTSIATNPAPMANRPANTTPAGNNNLGSENQRLATNQEVPSVPSVMPDEQLTLPTDNPSSEDPLATTPDKPTIPEANPDPLERSTVKPVTNTTDDEPVDGRKATELLAALSRARIAADAFATGDPENKEERRKLATEAYEAVCQLGPLSLALNLGSAQLASAKDELREFVASQASTPGQISTAAFLALKRIDDMAAPPGVFVVGKVTGVQPAGKEYAITLAVGKAMREVVVITAEDPADKIAVDDSVAVLGAIERDADRLMERDVAAEVAVMSRLLEKVE